MLLGYYMKLVKTLNNGGVLVSVYEDALGEPYMSTGCATLTSYRRSITKVDSFTNLYLLRLYAYGYVDDTSGAYIDASGAFHKK